MVPHHLHEPVAVEALAAGVHVLLEKPMAPTLDACDRILAAADRSEGLFLVAENAQYWPEVVAVQDALTTGTIGEVVTARAWHCFPPMGEFYEGDDPWRLSAAAAGGGVALDAGSHWLRPLRMWLGEISEVVAVTGRPYEAMESESLCRALCRFDRGVVASFDAIIPPGPVALSPLFEVVGTEGMIVVDPLGEVRLHDGTVLATGNYLESYEGQVAAFEAAVLDGTSPPADARFAVGELRAALAMYRSAESGRWEPVW
jgi:predicted dehydrogenase